VRACRLLRLLQGHASAHAAETGHLLIRAWKGGAFVYCFDHGYL